MLVALGLVAHAAVEVMPPRVILKLRPAIATASTGGLPGFRVVTPARGENVAAAAMRLAALPGVEAAEIDSPVRITPLPAVKAPLVGISTQITASAAAHGGELLPNDPLWPQQWGGVAATAPAAWAHAAAADAAATAAGDSSTSPPIVCIIDTGVDYTHPDLAPSMHPARGWNVLTNSNDPMDDNGHGTHCAGTVGAAWGNGYGTAGLAGPHVSILACKFINAKGEGQVSGIVECLDYCLRMGAAVSSNSYGVPGLARKGSIVAAAIAAAGASGHLFVAAAGNTGSDNDAGLAAPWRGGGAGWEGAGAAPPAPNAGPAFPAAFGLPTMLSVAAAELAPAGGGVLQLALYSNRGPRTTHLVAPGTAILSTWPGGGWVLQSGTSQAAPFVAGSAALLLAATRGRRSGMQARAALLATARRAPACEGAVETGGLLDTAAALEWALDAAQVRAPPAGELLAPPPPPASLPNRLGRARAHPLGGGAGHVAENGGVQPQAARESAG